MNAGTGGALMTVEQMLLVQLNQTLTDSTVRDLRALVGSTLEEKALRGVVLDLASVDVMDSYLTRCIRDLAISARLMGVPTVVCGVQPAVADTLVEMGMDLGGIKTTLSLDSAIRALKTATRPARKKGPSTR